MNNKQLTIIEQHRLGSHKEQPLLFPLVHLILCCAAYAISCMYTEKGEL